MRVSRQAKELLFVSLFEILMMMTMILTVTVRGGSSSGSHSVHFFILLKNPKFWGDFGAVDDFLGIALVEYHNQESTEGGS